MGTTKQKDKETKPGTEVATAAPAQATQTYNYGDDAGQGLEKDTNLLIIPFLAILQSNSPQVEERGSSLKAGQLLNTVTGEFWDGEAGVRFLPAHKERVYVEWKPRAKGGGFVAVHQVGSDIVEDALKRLGKKFGMLSTPDANDLVETYYVYGLTLDDAGKTSTGFATVAFTSTKIKPCRQWFTSMYMIKGQPPLFANRAIFKTVQQKNEKGSFYNFDIKPLAENWVRSLVDPKEEATLLTEGRALRDMVLNGMARADYATQAAGGQEERGAPGGNVDDDGAPPF